MNRRNLLLTPLPLLLGTAALASAQDGQSSPSAPTAGCQSILAPAYYWYDFNFFPQWDELIRAGAKDLIIVAGIPSSNDGPDPAFWWLIQEANKANIRVLAYVQTYFGQRDPHEITTAIDSMQEWYDIAGIFIDEIKPDHDDIDYYASIVKYVYHRPNQLTIINPGGTASREYVEMADMIVTFEGNFEQYLEYRAPDWMQEYSSERIIHLVHTASSSEMEQAVALSRERNAGRIYVTDDRPANAYHLLPTYWDKLVASVNTSCKDASQT